MASVCRLSRKTYHEGPNCRATFGSLPTRQVVDEDERHPFGRPDDRRQVKGRSGPRLWGTAGCWPVLGLRP
jgi:hypothetical protein